jgi:glycosyltransferase involved in cell wall biosynthesis
MTKTIVCCSETADKDWTWIASEVSEAKFHFVSCFPRHWIERRGFFNLSRFRGAIEAVRLSKHVDADLLVAHGPALTAWCAIFSRFLRTPPILVSYAFNFAAMPGKLKTRVFSWALATVDRFFVFSTIEKQLYSQLFLLSKQKFEFIYWGVNPPPTDFPPSVASDYVSAIGGNARDYFTLVEAARRLPAIRFVLVVRPHNLKGIDLPKNVTTRVNITFNESMRILFHSRFMVLPLINSEIPCGHVTIVAAMHLGKAMVVTASNGVSDYVKNDENAITIPPSDVGALVSGIERLWKNQEVCARLGSEGKLLAAQHCSEANVVDHFRKYLTSLQKNQSQN